MEKYRITKYNPLKRINGQKYVCEEWTSFGDIGKVFNDKKFSLNEYLVYEKKYCDAAGLFLNYLDEKRFKIRNVEKRFSLEEIKQYSMSKGLTFNKNDEKVWNKISEGASIKSECIENVLKHILREFFWCEIVNGNNENIIEIGYDYYMYFICEHMEYLLKNKIEMLGLYVERV